MSFETMYQEVRATLGALCVAAIGWLLIAPLALLVPRRRDWIAVIGRDDGKFVDNAKYFLLQAAPLLGPRVRIAFVTQRQDVVTLLAGSGHEVLRYPSAGTLWFLLRAGTTVVDSNEWWYRMRRFLLLGGKVVQLWHGVGFKRIENDKWRNEASDKGWLNSSVLLRLRLFKRILTGRQVHYDAVATTSAFYRDAVFRPAFRAAHFLVTGYPRNTFGQLPGAAGRLAWSNVDPAIAAALSDWVAQGRRIVLVAPTFRDSRATPIGLDPATVAALDAYCAANAVEMVFKFHPHERGASQVRGRYLHLCRAGSDLYPLMPGSSALITDYSSIYMDYLLLDKPVLFLVPDLEEYVRRDRQFQFDFGEMTPGPKLDSWKAVSDSLSALWSQDDAYAEGRARLRSMAFDDLPQHESVPKLLAFMESMEWIPSSGRESTKTLARQNSGQ